MLIKTKLNKGEFLEAFEKHHKFIYRFIYFKVNNSREVTEDLTQETFLKAWKNRNKFDSQKSNIKTWLATIARNTVIDNYRANRLMMEGGIDEKLESKASDQLDPLAQENRELSNESAILLDDVKSAMKYLKPKEREGLMLRYFEEFEISEIAKIWNEKPATIRTFIFRSLNKLKAIINEKA